jgi:azurin
MKRVSVLLVVLAAALFVARPLAQAPAAARVVEIEATEQMKFNVVALTAKPGETLKVRLKAVGTMPKMAMSHNFVLLQAGADAMAFANESAMAGPAANYIAAAKKAQVIASTALAGGGETVEVTFKAPAKAGAYTYLCSFPGHFAAGMKGVLTVK